MQKLSVMTLIALLNHLWVEMIFIYSRIVLSYTDIFTSQVWGWKHTFSEIKVLMCLNWRAGTVGDFWPRLDDMVAMLETKLGDLKVTSRGPLRIPSYKNSCFEHLLMALLYSRLACWNVEISNNLDRRISSNLHWVERYKNGENSNRNKNNSYGNGYLRCTSPSLSPSGPHLLIKDTTTVINDW